MNCKKGENMEKYISKKEKASYGFAAVGSYMVAGITQSYLMYFFTDILIIPSAFVMMLMIVARVWDALNDPMMGVIVDRTSTKYGKKVYAVGSNMKGAQMAGINTAAVKISVFVIAGVLVGIGAFLWIAMNASADPATTGNSYEMYAIAAAVLGGISMSGGKGKCLGILFGAMSYTIIDKIIVSLKMDSLINNAIKGIILLIVIMVQIVGPQIKQKFKKAE